MAASASGVLNARCGAELGLQSVRDLEDAALALHLRQVLLAAAIRHVLAESHDARIAAHLFMQRGVQQIDHGLRLALEFGQAC